MTSPNDGFDKFDVSAKGVHRFRMLAVYRDLEFDCISFAAHPDEQVQIHLRLERGAIESWNPQTLFKLHVKARLSQSEGEFQLQ